jgi:hypothetical protein
MYLTENEAKSLWDGLCESVCESDDAKTRMMSGHGVSTTRELSRGRLDDSHAETRRRDYLNTL